MTAAPAAHNAAERGRWRYRQAGLTSFAALLAKGAGLAATLLTIPLTAPLLGPERFGLFMTISTIPLLMSFADFGIGNGLLTLLASAHGRDDRDRARTLVSSAFFVLLGICILAAVLLVPVISFVPWATVLNLKSPLAVAEAPASIGVFVLCTVIGIPLAVPQRMQQAYQLGFITNLWLFVSNLLTFAALVVFVKLGKGLPWLVGAVAGATTLTGVFNWIFEFSGPRRWLRPSWHWVKIDETVHVAKAGLMIFSSQVCSTFLLVAPVLLLGHFHGQASVAPYAVVQRILSAFVVAASLVVTPLWPAYGEARARGDHAWIRKTYHRSLMATLLIAGIPLAVGAASGPALSSLFSSHVVVSDRAMAAAVALLCFCVAMRHTISMMVNGCGYLRRTAVGFPVAAGLAAGMLLIPAGVIPAYGVPVWVAAAEMVVIAVLLSDATRILRNGEAA